jgi:transcriptional regulator with XRE-family HTH domain
MPPNKIGLSEVKRLYDLIQDRSDIRQILESDPRNLLLLRLGMGYSLHKFSSLVGTSYVNISEIERGKRKSINPLIKANILSKTKSLPSFEQIEKNYNEITLLSGGGQKQAMKRAEKAAFTESERKLYEKLKQIRTKFLSHHTIKTSIGPVNVDFVIKHEPKDIIIEISDTVRRQKLESMAYRSIKIKNVTDALLVAIVPDRLTNALERRLEDFDVVLRFSDIERLEKKLHLTPQAAV